MLVIDEETKRILKMKERLLEISSENRDQVLKEYSDILQEIDRERFDELYSKIRNTNISKLSLEEQLEILTDLAEEYYSLYEFQCSYKDKYRVYANADLELSDLSKIYISNIEKRIDDISGYLINLSNLDKNKAKQDELNSKLILEEKAKVLHENEFAMLEEELKNNLLSAEGRIYDENGNRQVSSIREEYERIGIDLNAMLLDYDKLEIETIEAEKQYNSSLEDLNAALICYTNMPNRDTKKMTDDNLKMELFAKYKYVLLCILKLISEVSKDYDTLMKKREDILEKIGIRLVCLRKLSYDVKLDPFGRIKIEEQIKKIEEIGNSNKKIAEITAQMQELVTRNDELTSENNKKLGSLYDEVKLIDVPTIINETEKRVIIPVSELIEKSKLSMAQVPAPANKVINIRDIPTILKVKRARQKSSSVASSVNRAINEEVKIPVSVSDTSVIPQLVIEKKETKDDAVFTTEPVAFETTTSDSALVFEDKQETPFEESKPEVVMETPSVPEMLETTNNNGALFEDTVPFETPVLFNDRYDSLFVEGEDNESSKKMLVDLGPVNNNKLEDTMPDLFWVTQEEDNKEETENDNVLSFDEQVSALVSNNNQEDVKVRKLVA